MHHFSSPPNRRGFFESSSEQWGGNTYERGKYPAKIYTIDGVLIYQDDIGGDNTAKVPLGGVVVQSSAASSMAILITNPITHYYGWGGVINQSGHSGDLYDYYWTSYSRGTDGRWNTTSWTNEPSWHNAYLDGYIPLRAKSIYDPCPYLYRLPSNGTYNQFKSNQGWTGYSYLGGTSWNMDILGESWLPAIGRREAGSSSFAETGREGFYYSSTSFNQPYGCASGFSSTLNSIQPNHNRYRSEGWSVRCIGFATLYEP